MRTDCKAFPRTPEHENDSHAVTDAIRYVCDLNDFDMLRSAVFEELLIEGIGACDIEYDGESDQVVLTVVHYDRVFYDPHSRERDFSDSKYKGYGLWLYEDEVFEWYGEDEKVKSAIEGAYRSAVEGDSFDDRPKWADPKGKRVFIVELRYKEKGVWKTCAFTRGGYVKEPQDSVYLDEKGKPDCSMEIISAHINRNNERYGAVRQLIDLQDEINHRRSKALHLLSVRQVQMEKNAFSDGELETIRRELAKPDGVITTNPGKKIEVLQTGDMAAAQFQLLQEAKGEIDAVGANAALSGKENEGASGRAIQARQQGGMVELGPVFDALRHWQKRVYRQIWNRIRQFWTGEKWVRVTDDENNLKWVQLNRPVTQGEVLQSQGMLFNANDPAMQQVAGYQNKISELEVDIILEDVPDTINIQQEQFDQLVTLYQANPAAIPVEMIIQASSVRNKDQILEHIKNQQPQIDPMQQKAAELSLAKEEAEIAYKQSQTAENVFNMQKTAAEIAAPQIY